MSNTLAWPSLIIAEPFVGFSHAKFLAWVTKPSTRHVLLVYLVCYDLSPVPSVTHRSINAYFEGPKGRVLVSVL